jgi:hypothetical protein
MKSLLEKLNYKGQTRIALINSEKNLDPGTLKELEGIRVDSEIDQRFPYSFMIIFVKKPAEVDKYAPMALHNLIADGTLWFCYPKKTSRKFTSAIDRDHGWKALNDEGFYGIRLVSFDEDWSAMRFRNRKYIKSSSDRFAEPKCN